MGGKARKLEKNYEELLKFGAVDLQTAQEAVALRKYARAHGRIVNLRREADVWRLYDATQLMGEVV